MQPSADFSTAQEDERVAPLTLNQLGQTLQASFEAMTEEAIPQEMTLLLLRIALAEVAFSDVAADSREPEPLTGDVTLAFREYIASVGAALALRCA
jgi:hypothetical protein